MIVRELPRGDCGTVALTWSPCGCKLTRAAGLMAGATAQPELPVATARPYLPMAGLQSPGGAPLGPGDCGPQWLVLQHIPGLQRSPQPGLVYGWAAGVACMHGAALVPLPAHRLSHCSIRRGWDLTLPSGCPLCKRRCRVAAPPPCAGWSAYALRWSRAAAATTARLSSAAPWQEGVTLAPPLFYRPSRWPRPPAPASTRW